MVAPFDLKTIRQIDGVLHEPSRLCIAFALNMSEVLSFSELKALLGMTEPRKLCRLSGHGRAAFKEYLAILDQILLAARVGANGGGASPPEGGGPRGGTVAKEA